MATGPIGAQHELTGSTMAIEHQGNQVHRIHTAGDQLASARHTHRAAVHQRFVAALREGTPPPGSLPERVVVFGLSALPQQTLAQAEHDLERAFALQPGHALPEHVALVDDVMTTGSTLRAAGLALLKAGASRVDVLVVARTPKEDMDFTDDSAP